MAKRMHISHVTAATITRPHSPLQTRDARLRDFVTRILTPSHLNSSTINTSTISTNSITPVCERNSQLPTFNSPILPLSLYIILIYSVISLTHFSFPLHEAALWRCFSCTTRLYV